MELVPLHYAAIFVLGLIFGSFFNVCIHRWPKEDPKEREWVIRPSHCPKCGAQIKWYDNIPLFSWLVLLRGKCRACKAPISWRYPLVELSNAVLWVLTAWLLETRGLSGIAMGELGWWHLAFVIFFASLYLLTVVIDFEHKLIPDPITIGHFAGAWLMLWLCNGATFSSGWLESVLCALGLALLFFLFERLGAMGFGDVLLALGLGSLFGWPLTLALLVISVFVGGVIGIFVIVPQMIRKTYKFGNEIAYGPFLALGAYLTMFFGHDLINWYMRSFFPAGLGGGGTGLGP